MRISGTINSVFMFIYFTKQYLSHEELANARALRESL
jgi:hypothetical protein